MEEQIGTACTPGAETSEHAMATRAINWNQILSIIGVVAEAVLAALRANGVEVHIPAGIGVGLAAISQVNNALVSHGYSSSRAVVKAAQIGGPMLLLFCIGCAKAPPEVASSLQLEITGNQATVTKLEILINTMCDVYQAAKFTQIETSAKLDRTAYQSQSTSEDAQVNAQAKELAKTDPGGAVATVANQSAVRSAATQTFEAMLTQAVANKKAQIADSVQQVRNLIPLAESDSQAAAKINAGLQKWASTGVDSAQIDATMQKLVAVAQQLLPTTKATTTKAAVVPAP